MTHDGQSSELLDDKLTPDERRKFLCSNLDTLVHDDMLEIYKLLSSQVSRKLFSVHGDGCSINLDKLPDKVILSVYTLLKQTLDEY